MSATHRIGLLLVGFAFVLGNTFAGAQGEKAAAKVQKWEHMSASSLKNPKTEADHGEEGWELVGMVSNGRGGRGDLYYKRPKP